jgi:uncharacterized protein with ParB-like and HNH nuclease domain
MEVEPEQQEPIDAVESNHTWYEDKAEAEETEEYPIDQYDLTATPNDFNLLTIFSFIKSGSVKIPGFQRNYVWDIKRASKLIESLIIGLPVPQVFLYEEDRNEFLVIDGQQRLMSIYFFMEQRFPRVEKRSELRQVFGEHGRIPDDTLHDDRYFQKFNLRLPGKLTNQPNKFHGQNYSTLGEFKKAFELRPIRNIIVKQVSPKDDDSAIYEIFNRLNSGGINLMPQEIRMSLYHSDFYGMLYRANGKSEWRRLLGLVDPDLHMKDIEILLRGFALLIDGAKYNPSMIRFLNAFSRSARKLNASEILYLEKLFDSFLESCSSLADDAFHSTANRFSVPVFEAAFAGVCADAYNAGETIHGKIQPSTLVSLKADPGFLAAAERRTTAKINVQKRLEQARAIVKIA